MLHPAKLFQPGTKWRHKRQGMVFFVKDTQEVEGVLHVSLGLFDPRHEQPDPFLRSMWWTVEDILQSFDPISPLLTRWDRIMLDIDSLTS